MFSTMAYQEITPYVFHCNSCPTRCDGKTVPQFDFDRDLRFSEKIENQIIAHIHQKYPTLKAFKTTQEGYPDIAILQAYAATGHPAILCFLEIKGQARTFMSIRHLLPHSGLSPSETLALNLSDLERYFSIYDQEQIPTFLVWCLMRRPCLTGSDPHQQLYFHQDLNKLRQIRNADIQNFRRFKRASGRGDVVDGHHKGVVVNYHFSLKELKKGLPDLGFLVAPTTL